VIWNAPAESATPLPTCVVPSVIVTAAFGSANAPEVLGVAVNSKGTLAVLNHPGSATVGPLYGNASTQIFEFEEHFSGGA